MREGKAPRSHPQQLLGAYLQCKNQRRGCLGLWLSLEDEPGRALLHTPDLRGQVTAAERQSARKVSRRMTEQTNENRTKHMFLEICNGSHSHSDWQKPRREYRFDSDNDPHEDKMDW